MKYLKRLLLLAGLGGFSLSAQPQFSKAQVLADFDYLRTTLEDAHYNLYAYTSEAKFEQRYRQLRSEVVADSLSAIEAWRLFQKLTSAANNGHTEVPFPGDAYVQYAYADGTLFPLELAFEDGAAVVRKNWSSSPLLHPSTVITAINGEPISEVLARIFPLVSAERDYFKLAKIELYSFPRMYWLAYGQVPTFEITAEVQGETLTLTEAAVPVIQGYEALRNEVFFTDREFDIAEGIGYLRPGNFGGEYMEYQQFIDSAFNSLTEAGVEKLIVDLRNNLGGDDLFSDYLVSYFAREPFPWNGGFSMKTSAVVKAQVRSYFDTTYTLWQRALEEEDGSVFPCEFEKRQPQPELQRFKGEVVVLINRQSHSQSAVTAAQLQDLKLAYLIGEETGEYASPIASQMGLILPQTGMEVKFSKGQIIRVNGDGSPVGVQPDLFVRDRLLDERDEVLRAAMNYFQPSNLR